MIYAITRGITMGWRGGVVRFADARRNRMAQLGMRLGSMCRSTWTWL